MKFPYSEKVLEHFQNPQNVGEIDDPDGKSIIGSPACGDMVALYITVDEETNKITDIKFKSYGCASNIATGSIITELAKGKTLDEAKKITWKEASDALGGLPNIKVHCSVLAVDALGEAIQNYEEKHGLLKDTAPTTEETVRNRLKHVFNPLHGLDIVKTNLVKNIQIGDGIITIEVDLASDHQFAANIKSEILERLEILWDIDQVEVIFRE
jgi:nitrogen fixation protein NifU and related proteins